MGKRLMVLVMAMVVMAGAAGPAYGWDSYGHMAVAYIAYQKLTPEKKARVKELLKLNPKYDEWLGWVPANASQADKDMMVFMIAANWADEIKGRDSGYTSDGNQHGNRPDGSPNATANTGYDDKLMHKYWHFIDEPFSNDGTKLPEIPTPNAEERIALFRGVLGSKSADGVKSYDLVWLLHLVGDIHQPLHCVARVSKGEPDGDAGGNTERLSLNCPGCASSLHGFWDDLLGTGKTVQEVILPAIETAKQLPATDEKLASVSDVKEWVKEGVEAARQTVYQPPIGDGDGPFTMTPEYEKAAKALAEKRVALAGARLGNLINKELN